MSSSWNDLAVWWMAELKKDPTYESDVHPILLEMTGGPVGTAMDLGCGEGQGMRLVGADIFGCDLTMELLRSGNSRGRVVRAKLPNLSWLRDGSLDTAFSVYLLDLIEDHRGFFSETARVVKPDGILASVINHPAYTAVGAGPMLDIDDEILWRWGSYFNEGSSTEPAGDGVVKFFHRPMDALLTSAADEGWVLERMIERGLSEESVARMPSYAGQEHIPRLLGVRWRRARA
jgi:SAM-dependent methyltransferase